MSLRWFHMLFLLVMVMADLFGAWAIYFHGKGDDPLILGMGILSLVTGLAIAAYVAWLVQKLDTAHVQ
jgi:hypothetical protein